MAQADARDPDKMHGVPVFSGTRVPVQTLFDHLEGGDTLEEFLEGSPTVSRHLALEALEEAKQLLLARTWAELKVGVPMGSASASGYCSEDAARYDRQAQAHGWHGHEALFGMMYEFIKPRETLLDVGIGTGLSSVLFHKAGLRVSGFDSSREMLDMCEAKGFTVQAVQHDLRRVPYPYPAGSFDHVISLAVLNFLADLAPVFAEAARIVRPFGIFAFTLEEQQPGQSAQYVIRSDPNAAQEKGEMAIMMFRHSDAFVKSLLAGHGFTSLKQLEFLADRIPSEGIDVYFEAYVARKQEIQS